MTEPSAKEKIKLKKKLAKQKALEEPKEEQKQVTADNISQPVDRSQEPTDQKHGIEVLHIYPAQKKKAKLLARGTLVVKISPIGVKVRNIPYSIDQSKRVNIQPPFQYHRCPDSPDKPDAYVPTVTFDDKTIWKEVVKAAQEAVLKHHEVKADD